jgi:hypothetical protein
VIIVNSYEAEVKQLANETSDLRGNLVFRKQGKWQRIFMRSCWGGHEGS